MILRPLEFLREMRSPEWACSIAWIMHWPPKPGTAGSNPAAPATNRRQGRAFYQKLQPCVGNSRRGF